MEIPKHLRHIALLKETLGDSQFAVRAYRSAATRIEHYISHSGEQVSLESLLSLPGIGEGIGAVLRLLWDKDMSPVNSLETALGIVSLQLLQQDPSLARDLSNLRSFAPESHWVDVLSAAIPSQLQRMKSTSERRLLELLQASTREICESPSGYRGLGLEGPILLRDVPKAQFLIHTHPLPWKFGGFALQLTYPETAGNMTMLQEHVKKTGVLPLHFLPGCFVCVQRFEEELKQCLGGMGKPAILAFPLTPRFARFSQKIPKSALCLPLLRGRFSEIEADMVHSIPESHLVWNAPQESIKRFFETA